MVGTSCQQSVHSSSFYSLGDIIYTRLLNKPVVVISSVEVARDLFEGRSMIYSDKPQFNVYKQ